MVGFISLLWSYSLVNANFTDVAGVFSVVLSTVVLVSAGLLLCLPFACSLTYLSVFLGAHRRGHFFRKALEFVEQAPLLLYGVAFVLLLGKSHLSLILVFSFVATNLLSSRWSKLSGQVKLIEIEAMQALGLNVWQLIYKLYVSRYLVDYIMHIGVVLCELLLVSTPILMFLKVKDNSSGILSLESLGSVLFQGQALEVMVLFLLSIHFLRFVLNQKSSHWEVEFG